MLTAHLPAGFSLTAWLITKKHWPKRYLWIGLVASILPDIDLLYFFFIDHRQHLHHTYWTHLPFFWFGLAFFSAFFLRHIKDHPWKDYWLIFFSNVFFHLLLDTVVGKINWLFPFSMQPISLFTMPDQYGWWIWNIIFHWTFAFEIMIWIIALIVADRMGILKGTKGKGKKRA